MNESYTKAYETKSFISKNDDSMRFDIPFITPPDFNIDDSSGKVEIRGDSKEQLTNYYDNLSKSPLNLGGGVFICGTFDSLHIGHEVMLKTAASLGSELFIGAESKVAAMVRKKGKHPIESDYNRVSSLKKMGVTTPDKVFIRSTALSELERLENEGEIIKTFAVGCTQNDNPEMVEAVKYCRENNIQVVAINRSKALNSDITISSTSLREKYAKQANSR